MQEFKFKHFAVIFGIATLAILFAPKVISLISALPIVGPLLTSTVTSVQNA
jgi:hypothetical protein